MRQRTSALESQTSSSHRGTNTRVEIWPLVDSDVHPAKLAARDLPRAPRGLRHPLAQLPRPVEHDVEVGDVVLVLAALDGKQAANEDPVIVRESLAQKVEAGH